MLQLFHLIIIFRTSKDFGRWLSNFSFGSSLRGLIDLENLFHIDILQQMSIEDLKYFEQLKVDLIYWLKLLQRVELLIINHQSLLEEPRP
jgi:hypothetical protein